MAASGTLRLPAVRFTGAVFLSTADDCTAFATSLAQVAQAVVSAFCACEHVGISLADKEDYVRCLVENRQDVATLVRLGGAICDGIDVNSPIKHEFVKAAQSLRCAEKALEEPFRKSDPSAGAPFPERLAAYRVILEQFLTLLSNIVSVLRLQDKQKGLSIKQACDNSRVMIKQVQDAVSIKQVAASKASGPSWFAHLAKQATLRAETMAPGSTHDQLAATAAQLGNYATQINSIMDELVAAGDTGLAALRGDAGSTGTHARTLADYQRTIDDVEALAALPSRDFSSTFTVSDVSSPVLEALTVANANARLVGLPLRGDVERVVDLVSAGASLQAVERFVGEIQDQLGAFVPPSLVRQKSETMLAAGKELRDAATSACQEQMARDAVRIKEALERLRRAADALMSQVDGIGAMCAEAKPARAVAAVAAVAAPVDLSFDLLNAADLLSKALDGLQATAGLAIV